MLAAPDPDHPMPDDPSIDDWFDEANGHLAIGELDEAIELYRHCVESSPTFFDGWHALGMALMKTDRLKEAIGCGLQAVTLKPNDLLAWTSLSQMYVRDGNIPEAEAAKANARILSLGGRIVKDG
jgi:predicted Zn-dependent protease